MCPLLLAVMLSNFTSYPKILINSDDFTRLWETETMAWWFLFVVISTFPSVDFNVRMMETEHTQRSFFGRYKHNL